MKILILKTREIIDLPAGLALRKIEQGKAVTVQDTTKAAKKEKTVTKAGDA